MQPFWSNEVVYNLLLKEEHLHETIKPIRRSQKKKKQKLTEQKIIVYIN